MLSFKKMTSLEKKFFLKNLFLIIFGCISLAFGTALFLTKLNIVAGGLSASQQGFRHVHGESSPQWLQQGELAQDRGKEVACL